MGAYCRACGYTFQKSESKNVCPMCGSIKIRHGRDLEKITKIYGTIVVVTVVILVFIAGIDDDESKNIIETAFDNDESENIIEEKTIMNDTRLQSDSKEQDKSEVTEMQPRSDEKQSDLLTALNPHSEVIFTKCKSSIRNWGRITIDCGEHGIGEFWLPPDYNKFESYLDDSPYVSIKQTNGVYSIIHDNFNFTVFPSNDELVTKTPVENSNESQIPDQETSPDKQSESTKPDEKELNTEIEIHRLVNIERQKHGLVTLSYDDALASIARNHSEDMAKRKFFSHVNPDGQDHTARALNAGYKCEIQIGNVIYGLGENLHMKSGSTITFWDSPESIAKDAVEGWMNSAGHRENILTDHYISEGIGVEITTFEIYVTQNFC